MRLPRAQPVTAKLGNRRAFFLFSISITAFSSVYFGLDTYKLGKDGPIGSSVNKSPDTSSEAVTE